MKTVSVFCISALLLASIVYLHRTHKIAFATPKIHQQPARTPELRVEHFLAESCGCSHILKDHLLRRGPAVAGEKVTVLIGDRPERARAFAKALSAAGFQATAEAREVSGTPLLRISGARGELLYEGGYTEGMITPFSQFRDLELIDQFRTSATALVFAPVGCPQDKLALNLIDPLGVIK